MRNITNTAELFESIENDDIEFKTFYIKQYKRVVKSIEDPMQFFKMISEKQTKHLYELMPLCVGAFFYRRNFKAVFNFVKDVDLSGYKREYEFYISKLIKYYYWSCVELNCLNINEFHSLKVKNSQYGNKTCLLVLNNILMDYYINNKVEYLDLIIRDIEKEEFTLDIYCHGENALYYFYNGFANLLLGNYVRALKHFDEADIYNNKRSLYLNIVKCTIVTRLLLGDVNIVVDYNKELLPYFSLIGIVKRGEIDKLDELLHKNYEEFATKMRLLLVLRRLVTNVLKIGINEIARVYSKISLEQINKIFGMDVSCLVHKIILDGGIQNVIEEKDKKLFLVKKSGCILSKCRNGGVNDEINRIITIKNALKRQMNYKKTPPRSMESLTREKEEFEQKFSI